MQMDGCSNDILAPLILAVMVANGHPLSLDEIADGVTELINAHKSSEDAAETIGDGKHDRKRSALAFDAHDRLRSLRRRR